MNPSFAETTPQGVIPRPNRHRRLYALACAALALTACGGGGGGTPPVTTPVMTPVITTPTPSVTSQRIEFSSGGEDIAFGIDFRNGRGHPWTTGPAPLANLVDNRELIGTVSWSGHLLGFTPESEAVRGDAGLTIDLETLDGYLDFANLKHWVPDGSGTTWNDGDLAYDIAVHGNTFSRTGGDDGIVSGSFLGTTHQAMGGTLQRDDLSAAFGGGARRVIPPPLPDLPLQGPEHSTNVPIFYIEHSLFERNLYIGADVAPPPASFQPGVSHGGIAVSHGGISDGIGADKLIAYLEDDVDVEEYNRHGHLQRFGAAPPTVRVAEGTIAELRDEAVRAVQELNAALPRDWQLQISPVPGPAVAEEGTPGEILIHFLPYDEWPVRYRDRPESVVGIAPFRFRSTEKSPTPLYSWTTSARLASSAVKFSCTRSSIRWVAVTPHIACFPTRS